jgi:signal transduction histidine kinase
MVYTTIYRRVALFSAALIVAPLVIGLAGWIGWLNSTEFSQKIRKEELESYNIGDEFNGLLSYLHSRLRRYQNRQEAVEWQHFQVDRTKLDKWIDEQKSRVHTSDESNVLEKIDRTFDDYYRAASLLHDRIVKNPSAKELADAMDEAEGQADRLIALDTQLLKAHDGAMERSISDWRGRLHWLQALLFGALLMLVVSAALLGVILWRDMIRPLRLQLVESQDLLQRQEKLASLGFLAAGVAHEIRNPLTAIKARLYTQQKSLPEDSPATADAKVISGEINRLERIVKGFLDFARPEEPSMRPIDARNLMDEVSDLLKPQVDGASIELKFQPGATAEVEADPGQMKQVLINLIQNATEAAGKNGRVTLRVRTSAHRFKGSLIPVVIFEVEDNGGGIPSDIQARLFDPFFTTKESGTGLGLSIAARIVEKHGGLIEFQTDPSQGTTFGIILPRAEAGKTGDQGAARKQPSLTS